MISIKLFNFSLFLFDLKCGVIDILNPSLLIAKGTPFLSFMVPLVGVSAISFI